MRGHRLRRSLANDWAGYPTPGQESKFELASERIASIMATLADVGEKAILDHIRTRIERHTPPPELVVGSGDDGAVWAVSEPVNLVVSQDALVEGKDWVAGWLTPKELGR